MEHPQPPQAHDPIIMTDAELIAIWERLGVSFRPEIVQELAASILREVENNLVLPILDKLYVLDSLNEIDLDELRTLNDWLCSKRNTKTTIPDKDEYLIHALVCLAAVEVSPENATGWHCWTTHLILCGFGDDCSQRIELGHRVLTTTLRESRWFLAWCLSEGIQFLLESLPQYDITECAKIEMKRGIALYELKQPTRALAAFNSVWQIYQEKSLQGRAELDIQRLMTLTNRGVTLLRLGRLLNALADLNAAWTLLQRKNLPDYIVDLNVQRVIVLINKGNALIELHRSAEALEAFDKALVNCAENILEGFTELDKAKIQIGRGIALSYLGQKNKSLDAYDAALSMVTAMCQGIEQHNRIALECTLATIYMNRGNVLNDLNRPEEALTDLKMSLDIYQGKNLQNQTELDYERAKSLTLIGSQLDELGQPHKALASYERACNLFLNILRSNTELDIDRARLFCNAIKIISIIPLPHSWALEKSCLLRQYLELAPPADDADVYLVRHQELRQFFAFFHDCWLTFCLDTSAYEQLPIILSLLQGRKLAGAILDELDQCELDPNTPESVKQLKKLRLEIRKLDANIRELIAGGGVDGFHDGGLRATVLQEKPVSPERQQRLDTLRAARSQTFEHYLQQRNRVAAEVPEFQIIQPDHDRLRIEELGRTLKPGQALALLLDFTSRDQDNAASIQGVLLIRPDRPLSWLPLSCLHGLSDRLALYNCRMSGHGLRRSRELSIHPHEQQEPMMAEELEHFWPDMAVQMHREFWEPLNAYLAGIDELLVIGHGRLHLLPIECGAPASLSIRHYPGLIFYAQQQGLLGPVTTDASAETVKEPLQKLGILSYDDLEQYPIPLVNAESQVLKDLWDGRKLIPTIEGDQNATFDSILGKSTDKDPKVQVLHVACHGSGTDDKENPDFSFLKVGVDFDLNMPKLLSLGKQPEFVILSSCLAGQTAEDLHGDPLGLVSGWFLKGTRQLVAAVASLPDLYMPLFSALLHQALLDMPEPSLRTALATANRRLALGDWVDDAELADPIREHIGEYLRIFYKNQIDAYARQPDWLECWQALKPELQNNACSDRQLDELETHLFATPKPSAAAIAKRCSQAVVERLFESPIPPRQHLDTLRYAIRCYG
jgi:tetratricopeptide (TPR) repeat protein